MLAIAGGLISMVIALGVIWNHPMQSSADRLAFWKFLSLWLVVVATATGQL